MNKTLNILLILLIILPLSVVSQITLIPDYSFEQQLINLGYDTTLDGQVATQSIDTITRLDITNTNISDLSGIEDFTNLSKLWCDLNCITTLDLSNNSNLVRVSCTYNQLTILKLPNNLTTLYCYGNDLTQLDLTNCYFIENLYCGFNKLTTLDLSNNQGLRLLSCPYNKLNSLDISGNPFLFVLSCVNNELTELNLKNGNNNNFGVGYSCGLGLYISDNPYLTCVMVDDPNWSTNNWLLDSNQIDTQHYFNYNCNSVTLIEENITTKSLIQIVDISGRRANPTNNVPLFYIYSDGTIEKKIIIK